MGGPRRSPSPAAASQPVAAALHTQALRRLTAPLWPLPSTARRCAASQRVHKVGHDAHAIVSDDGLGVELRGGGVGWGDEGGHEPQAWKAQAMMDSGWSCGGKSGGDVASEAWQRPNGQGQDPQGGVGLRGRRVGAWLLHGSQSGCSTAGVTYTPARPCTPWASMQQPATAASSITARHTPSPKSPHTHVLPHPPTSRPPSPSPPPPHPHPLPHAPARPGCVGTACAAPP